MSKAFFPTNDGHIGNIEKLTIQELTDLIQRHNSLLKKKNFIQKLPDKGKKNEDFLYKLKQELNQRKLSNPQARNTRTDNSQVDAQTERLYYEFDRLDVNDSKDPVDEKPKHFFEVAEERFKQNEKILRKCSRLNQNLKALHVEDCPAAITSMQPPKNYKTEKQVTVVPEESAAVPPSYKYSEVQIIPLEESLFLQKTQKEKVDKIQAIAAAERLSQTFGFKMEAYNPEGVDMSYRGATQPFDSDTDDIKHEDIFYDGDELD